MSKQPCLPQGEEQALLEQVQPRLSQTPQFRRCHRLLDDHHYLKRIRPVGERLHHAATDTRNRWLGVLVFSAPAQHLKHRDRWIGWTAPQRDRRLPLVVNNSRFLLARICHREIKQRSGERVRRLDSIEPNETAPHRCLSATDCNGQPMLIQDLGARKVVADVSGGTLSSDGGVLLVRQVDLMLGLTRRLADCFEDARNPPFVEHLLPQPLAQRIYTEALGYEDRSPALAP